MKSPNNTTEPCWGEFPSKQRQAELRQRIQVWAQEDDHGDQPGPFAEFKLTGADIFWLVAWVAGGEDAEAGKASLDKYQHGVGLSVRVDLSDLPLDGASLYRAHLENAQLFRVQLRSASLYGAYLEGADLGEAQLQHANLFEAQLQQAKLSRAQMQGANLNKAQMEGADLNTAQLEGANLTEAHLQRANLQWTQLQNARLHNTYFQRAALRWTQLQGADLTYCDLRGADLRSARLDINTILDRTRLDDQVHLADVAWNGSSLSRVDWEAVPRLGDEVNPGSDESPRDAARAYRQLAVALREQGITEAADRYTYRSLVMQRKYFWWHWRFSKLGAYFFSLFLAVLTGYGFRMWRIILAYVLIILAFAAAYWRLGFQNPPGLSFWQAIIVSVTAFHGRVFANPFTLNEPQIAVTALEAIFGLVIEGVFIAMLTQRFFNR